MQWSIKEENLERLKGRREAKKAVQKLLLLLYLLLKCHGKKGSVCFVVEGS